METSNQYSEDEKRVLIQSMCGLLMNKLKYVIQSNQKNKALATNQHLNNLIELVAEHLLP
jgi:hypothetical protein